MRVLILFSILFVWCGIHHSSAQNDDICINNQKVKINSIIDYGSYLVMNYDLNLKGRRIANHKFGLYNLSFEYSSNGVDFEPMQTLYSKSSNRAKLSIAPQRSYTVVWDYQDDIYGNLTPNALKYRIRAAFDFKAEQTWLLQRGKLENTLLSFVRPGWSSQKLDQNNRKYWSIAIATWGLMGSGIALHINSSIKYNQYQDSSTFNEADPLFNDASNSRKIGKALWISGLSILAGEILWTGFKRLKSKIKAKKLKNEKYPNDFCDLCTTSAN